MARRGFSGAVMRGLRVNEHLVTVMGRQQLAPHFVRIDFESATLFDQVTMWPTAWLRLWFPDPTKADFEHQRGYTISRAEPGKGQFSCDFVLHEPAGPASAWAASADPGDHLAAMSMGAKKFEVPASLPNGYLLIGDPASVPAINAILDAVPPPVPVELYLEQQHPEDDDIPLAEHPALTVHRVPRTGPGSLAAAISRRDWTGWLAWAAPEAGSLKQLKPLLRKELGFTKASVYSQAYWSAGRAMGSQR